MPERIWPTTTSGASTGSPVISGCRVDQSWASSRCTRLRRIEVRSTSWPTALSGASASDASSTRSGSRKASSPKSERPALRWASARSAASSKGARRSVVICRQLVAVARSASTGSSSTRGVDDFARVAGMADAAREIENLLYTYAERIDSGDLEGVADLFVHGRILAVARCDPGPRDRRARWRPRAVSGLDTDLRGRQPAHQARHDELPSSRSKKARKPPPRAATSRSSSDSTTSRCSPSSAGRYHDTFQRIDGRWWFDTRIMIVDLVGDLSRHLLFKLEA